MNPQPKIAQGIPLSSDEIPAGTGLVQSVECQGIRFSADTHTFESLLNEPVVAQITTFAKGMRHVCCPKAVHASNGAVKCAKYGGSKCIYAWENTGEADTSAQ